MTIITSDPPSKFASANKRTLKIVAFLATVAVVLISATVVFTQLKFMSAPESFRVKPANDRKVLKVWYLNWLDLVPYLIQSYWHWILFSCELIISWLFSIYEYPSAIQIMTTATESVTAREGDNLLVGVHSHLMITFSTELKKAFERTDTTDTFTMLSSGGVLVRTTVVINNVSFAS